MTDTGGYDPQKRPDLFVESDGRAGVIIDHEEISSDLDSFAGRWPGFSVRITAWITGNHIYYRWTVEQDLGDRIVKRGEADSLPDCVTAIDKVVRT